MNESMSVNDFLWLMYWCANRRYDGKEMNAWQRERMDYWMQRAYKE